MTDKTTDNIDDDFSLNHFDQAVHAGNEENDASTQSEAFYTADLFAEAERPESYSEEEKADPFDSTLGADRFADLGYRKKEPTVPQPPKATTQTEPPAKPAAKISDKPEHTPTHSRADDRLKHPDPFDSEPQHTDAKNANQTPITQEQKRPDSVTIGPSPLPPPADKPCTGFKPISAFAIIAMLVAAIAIWLNPGDKENLDRHDTMKAQRILGEDIHITRLESHLSAMEQQSAQQNRTLEQQMEQLKQQVSTLTSRLDKQVSKQPARRHSKAPSTSRASGKQAVRRNVTSPTHPVVVAKATTGWVLNLVSVDSRYAADKALVRYKAQGISASVFSTVVKGKPWYRLRITGFANRQEAATQKNYLAKKYGIKDAWIQKP